MQNPKLVVGDFGCGDARLAQSVPNKVHSFDLVAVNEHVTACDIANVSRPTESQHLTRRTQVPLEDGVLDVAVFSLSLMGVNYMDFIREAWRTLKPRSGSGQCVT